MSELLASTPDPLGFDPRQWLRYLHQVVNQHALRWESWDEVFSDAAVAYMRASRAFDPSRGSIPALIQVAVRRFVSNQRLIRWNYRHCVPRCSVRYHSAAARRAYSGPSLMVFSEVSPRMVRGRDHAFAQIEPEEDAGLNREDAARIVAELMPLLSTRSQLVMRRRWGLDGGKPETLEEIGRDLGITKERVRQITWKAIRDMQEYLKKKWGKDFTVPSWFRKHTSLAAKIKQLLKRRAKVNERNRARRARRRANAETE